MVVVGSLALMIGGAQDGHIAGRRTMKRAPSTAGGSPGAAGSPSRFSTQMRPSWRLDDLLGDRQAEAGVLSEAVVRAVGVEALEHLVDRVRLDARTVVVDDDLDLVLGARGR